MRRYWAAVPRRTQPDPAATCPPRPARPPAPAANAGSGQPLARPNRGQFPSEQAALKVLYLAVRNLEEFRGRNVGIRSSGWKQALQAFTIHFDGRIPTP